MKPFLMAYGSALVAFLVIDGLWLGVIAKSFYVRQLGDLLRSDKPILPVLLFYFGFPAGLVVLAVRPGQPEQVLLTVALHGGLVGLLAYGTYHLTNSATLRHWPIRMSVVDGLWGTGLSAAVAILSAMGMRYLS